MISLLWLLNKLYEFYPGMSATSLFIIICKEVFLDNRVLCLCFSEIQSE